jgi:hypothetical protein
MPIHVGISCERCGKVHFIVTSKRIEFAASDGSYRLACMSPCGAIRYFRKEQMLVYAVSGDIFTRGYAERN